MSVIQVTDSNFDQTLQNDELVLVDFWAPWCAPCRVLAPMLDELDEKMNGKVTIAKLNIDENPEVASRFSIMAVPTLKLFKNGKEVETVLGVQSLDELAELLSKHS